MQEHARTLKQRGIACVIDPGQGLPLFDRDELLELLEGATVYIVNDYEWAATRERLEIHAANPTCNSCHRFMDPIGLALDSYDVTGRLRTRENGAPLDTRGTFYDGTDVSTAAELLDVLMKRPIPLVRNFAENMLAYAIGRRVEYYDQPAIRALVRDAEANDYRMTSFILGVVNSVPFQMTRSGAVAEQQTEP